MGINTILKNYKNEKLGRFAPQFFIFIVVPNCINFHILHNFWKNKIQKYFLDNSKTRTKKYFWNRVPKTPSTNKFWRFLNKKSKTKAILICEIGVLTSKVELVWILLIGPVIRSNHTTLIAYITKTAQQCWKVVKTFKRRVSNYEKYQ